MQTQGEISTSCGRLNDKVQESAGSVGPAAAHLWLEVGVAVEQW